MRERSRASSLTQGEGEHKIVDFIRRERFQTAARSPSEFVCIGSLAGATMKPQLAICLVRA